MMTRAFDIIYIEDAMTLCGSVLDYAVNACGEDPVLFYARFLASGVAAHLFRAAPSYLGRSGTEVARIIAERTGRPLAEQEPIIDIGSPEYWSGWTLAYVTWYLNVSYSTLNALGIGIMAMLAHYPVLHEADLSKSVRFVQRAIAEAKKERNPLKAARINAGFTQESLAKISGLTRSAIRSYEQGQRLLANASAGTVRSLRQVTGCDPDYLLI